MPAKDACASGATVKKVKKSKTAKARLIFSVGRTEAYMKSGRFADRVASGAPVFMAAVLETITAELIELAGNQAKDDRKNRIRPRHLQLAIRDDPALDTLFHGVTIAGGGVAPGIHKALKPKSKKPRRKLLKKSSSCLSGLSKLISSSNHDSDSCTACIQDASPQPGKALMTRRLQEESDDLNDCPIAEANADYFDLVHSTNAGTTEPERKEQYEEEAAEEEEEEEETEDDAHEALIDEYLGGGVSKSAITR